MSNKSNNNNKTQSYASNSKKINNTSILTTATSTGNITYTPSSYSNLATTYTVPYTTSSSNYTWTTSGYVTFDDGSSTYRAVIEALTEDEINELLDKFIERLSDKSDSSLLDGVMRQIFNNSSRIFSEDTILKYIKYLDINSIEVTYKPYIKSRQYSRLALYLEASK